MRKKLGDITLASTTDGNHGRGIAWTAEQLKQKCVINMPRGSTIKRVKAIEEHGATIKVLNINYDEAVRYTDKQAKKHGWVIARYGMGGICRYSYMDNARLPYYGK